MPNLDQVLSIVYMIVIIASICGAFFIGRKARTREINLASTQLNETLDNEIKALRRRVTDLERDRNRQYDIIDTIRFALKQENLQIVIDGEFVSLLKPGVPSKITRIKTRQQTAQLTQEDDDEDAS